MQRNILEMKLAHLQTLEMARQQQQVLVEQNEGKGDSYATKLVIKILENLYVSISRIHIRYEEDGVMAAGVALGRFQVRNTAVASQKTSKATFKDMELSDFSIYLDVSKEGLLASKESAGNHEAWIEQMRNGIGSTSNYIHDYLLAPTSGLAKCVKAPPADSSSPKMQVDVELHRIALTLSSSQFQVIKGRNLTNY